MADPYLKIYTVKHFNHWPYESVESAILAERRARALLPANKYENDCTFRIYLWHPDRYVEIAPMEVFNESWMRGETNDISPYQLLDGNRLAYQIDFVLFGSYQASDYEKIEGVIESVNRQADHQNNPGCPPPRTNRPSRRRPKSPVELTTS